MSKLNLSDETSNKNNDPIFMFNQFDLFAREQREDDEGIGIRPIKFNYKSLQMVSKEKIELITKGVATFLIVIHLI